MSALSPAAGRAVAAKLAHELPFYADEVEWALVVYRCGGRARSRSSVSRWGNQRIVGQVTMGRTE